jgi:hypothetical protein
MGKCNLAANNTGIRGDAVSKRIAEARGNAEHPVRAEAKKAWKFLSGCHSRVVYMAVQTAIRFRHRRLLTCKQQSDIISLPGGRPAGDRRHFREQAGMIIISFGS